VVGCARRAEPGWDEALHPVIAVLSPAGGVLSVPPAAANAVRELIAGRADDWRSDLAATVGDPDRPIVETVFRFTTTPAPLPDVGTWIDARDPSVPPWLRPFGREVLVALDDTGDYLAGVGLKRHDAVGREVAVGTEPRARGKGLASCLVAQAARWVLAAGALPTYRHELGNTRSARVAQAAGFPDRGWRALTLAELT
jgi:GNAT superfamily N-acetyltransferase